MYGETIRTLEQLEIELEDVAWRIKIADSFRILERFIVMRQMDDELLRIEDELRRLGNAEKS